MKKIVKYFMAVCLYMYTGSIVFSQTKIDTVYIQYPAATQNTVKNSASYYRVRTISNGMLKAEDYSMKDSVLKCSGYYTNFDPYIKHGPFVYYSTTIDGGIILGGSEGNYLNDEKDGVWKYYYPSGELFYTQEYFKGKKNGIRKSYYKTGEVKRIDQYNKGKWVQERCYTKQGKDTACYEVQILPSFPGGRQAQADYFLNNLIYPQQARANRIEGTVYVWYVVNKDGSISDVEIVKGKGVHPLLDQEAIRCVKNMPSWTPGYIDGVPMNVKMVQKVKFSLSE